MRVRLFGLAVFMVCSAVAETVIRVKDGDTITVESGGQEVDIRLAGIDAPESDQAHGPEALRVLRALVDGRDVELELVGGDAYRRIVARVFAANIDVNAELVRRGLVWVPRDYDPAPDLIHLEDEAREARRGLWADAAPVPPWVWRTTERPAALPQPLPLTVAEVECGAKRYCREMTTCDEAIGHLRQCERTTLDSDGDGLPCERICGGVYQPSRRLD